MTGVPRDLLAYEQLCDAVRRGELTTEQARARLDLPLFILAQDRAEARAFADEHGIRPKDWVLMTETSARGYNRIRLARVGHWRLRRDLKAIEDTLRIITATGEVIEERP